MADSKNITATKGRLTSNLHNVIGKAIDSRQIEKMVDTKIQNSKANTGIVTKFYPHLDKAEVLIDGSKKKVLCSILHRFGGELIEFYTPNGDRIFCNKLKEPAIKPRGALRCFVMHTQNEWLLLGYFIDEELIGINPAAMGDMKLTTRGGTNQYWIKFGYAGLDIRSSTRPVTNVGEMDKDMEYLEYANAKKIYTREELDVIIAGYEARIKKLEELAGITDEDSDDTTTNTNDNTNSDDNG